MEAAQQAISSPLLDNISIAGATGVLINITGGDDLTLGEVTQISEAIHDAAGDEAEIIFGAVNDPAMHGEVRVTVIATGFERAAQAEPAVVGRGAPGVLPFEKRVSRPTPVPPSGYVRPAAEPPARRAPTPPNEGSEMEIPTFIRRQRPGLVFHIRRLVTDSPPDRLMVRTGPVQRLWVERSAAGWTQHVETIPWTIQRVRVVGLIESSLYDALDQAVPDSFLPAVE